MKKILLLLFACAVLCIPSYGQTPVSLFNGGQFSSLLSNGAPNAFGCVFTYQPNSTTPQSSWTDNTGLTLNPDPVLLSAGGTANIWLATGSLYSIVVKTSGGINCSAGSTVYTANGINGSLLNSANTWDSPQTFAATTYFLLPDLQLVFGTAGAQTTLDIPPTPSNVVLHGPPLTGNDTLLSQNATQVVENKNLTVGTEVNGCGMTNGPATYICIPNNSVTATIVGGLAVLTGAPSTASAAPTGTQSGIVGVVTAGAGITGTATIQTSGVANCTFDNGTTAGDYFGSSGSIIGDCDDLGIAPPTQVPVGIQAFGQVLASGGGGTTSANFYNVSASSPTGTPTLSVNYAGAGTGATGSVAIHSSDHYGQISIATGSSPSTNSAVAVLTFGYTGYTYMFCTLTPGNGTAALAATYIWTISSPLGMQLEVGGTALSGTYTWIYACNQ